MTVAADLHESLHGERVRKTLRARIEAAGGWLPFEQYMQIALYEPGLGYYSAGARKFGAGGDFTTAPEISPLFGQCLAVHCDEVLAALDGGEILEVGAGTGRLACDVLLASPQARFADTHARVGVAPGWGLSQRLSRAIGIYRAREVSLSGNWVSAEQAAAWGFVNRVVPAEGLLGISGAAELPAGQVHAVERPQLLARRRRQRVAVRTERLLVLPFAKAAVPEPLVCNRQPGVHLDGLPEV